MRRSQIVRIGLVVLSVLAIIALNAGQAHGAPRASVDSWFGGWPMAGHDPQRTNRSPVIGPLHPQLLFSTAASSGLPPAIAADGSIAVWRDNALVELNETGRRRWQYGAAGDSPPAISRDGTVVFKAFTNGRMSLEGSADIAVNGDGTPLWTVRHIGFAKNAAPLVTAQGVAMLPYVGPTEVQARLDRISPVGRVQTLQAGFSFYAVAAGRDGSLYAVGRYSSHEDLPSVERLAANGRVLWRHKLQHQGGGLLVGQHGTIFVSDGQSAGYDGSADTVSADTAAGRVLWSRSLQQGRATLAQRADGVLLAAGQRGLSAIGADGKPLWQTPIGFSSKDAVPSIAVDRLGTAYIGSGDGLVRIVSRGGSVVGQLRAGPGTTRQTPAVALGPGGRLVVVGTDNRLRVYG